MRSALDVLLLMTIGGDPGKAEINRRERMVKLKGEEGGRVGFSKQY